MSASIICWAPGTTAFAIFNGWGFRFLKLREAKMEAGILRFPAEDRTVFQCLAMRPNSSGIDRADMAIISRSNKEEQCVS